MRIAILGAGAVGGFLAASLAEAGHAVTVLVRGAHLEAIRADGLQLRDAAGGATVARIAATDDPAALGPQDLVLTTLKAPALADVLAHTAPSLRSATPVITAMNGVFWWYPYDFAPGLAARRLDPGGRLAALLDPAQAIGAVIHSTNQVIAPGVVMNRSAHNRFVIGGPGPTAPLEALAQDLSCPRASFERAADIRLEMWRKLLRNLSSAPISVLTGARVREINDDAEAAQLARALFLEGAAVARSHGFGGLAGEVENVVAPGQGALQQPSMRQDLNLGRPMEIDAILGSVQDFARAAGVATPVLDVMLPLVRLAGEAARTAAALRP